MGGFAQSFDYDICTDQSGKVHALWQYLVSHYDGLSRASQEVSCNSSIFLAKASRAFSLKGCPMI